MSRSIDCFILLQRSLAFQHTSKVNSSDNNLNYHLTEKNHITFSYMKSRYLSWVRKRVLTRSLHRQVKV